MHNDVSINYGVDFERALERLIGMPLSASFKMATICDSVKRFVRMENLRQPRLPDVLLSKDVT